MAHGNGSTEVVGTGQRARALRRSVPARRPTMADVARAAGVSPSTVSFVVNDRRDMRISPTTRQRVLDSIAELGYRTNHHARGLRIQSTRTLGFVTDEIGVEAPAGQTIAGVHDVARRHDSVALIVHSDHDEDVLRGVVDDLLDRRVDALVYAVAGTRRVRPISQFRQVPTVLLNALTADHSLPSVLPAESVGQRDATAALLAAGHRRLAYVTGSAGAWATAERVRGFRSAVRAAGIGPDDVTVSEGTFRSDSGYELTRHLLRQRRRPTALLCGNDLMAVGAYFALKEEGMRIPDDMSVIGYDDQEDVAAFLTPALSTVRLPYYAMGTAAARNLFGDGSTIPSRSFVRCPLVPRASDGPPPRRRSRGR